MTRTPIFDELYAKYVTGTPARDVMTPPAPAPHEPWQDQTASSYTGRHQTPEWPTGE
ncbi:hypothetical protein [Lentzea sp. NPDC059081]|uniref:hypothetical protein n=1 Tax=Lentzea sp. NPDC059081 TaxID=3346719 RepID=UPI00369EBEC8